MRIAILGDAHGNRYGFFAALADAGKEQPDLIVSTVEAVFGLLDTAWQPCPIPEEESA